MYAMESKKGARKWALQLTIFARQAGLRYLATLAQASEKKKKCEN